MFKELLAVLDHRSYISISFPPGSQKLAEMLRRQDKDRRWRTNYKRLEKEVNSIEEDEYQLERVYPQVRTG